MKINNIKLHNFQCFEKYETSFSNLTFIKGQNGIGKTTLGVDAILFAIFGYSRKNLADVPTRNKAKSCSVELEVEHGGLTYIIKRSYPTQLQITKNGELMKFATAMEGQRFLESIFNNLKYFQQFRLFDTSIGINILEEGQQALKKILFAVSDELFNNVREKLNNIKHNREIWCKDKAVIYSHFPSEKRLRLLEEKFIQVSEELDIYKLEIRKYINEETKLSHAKGQLDGQLKTATWQKDKIAKETTCYACKQELSKETKEKMKKQNEEEVENLQKQLKGLLEELTDLQEIKKQQEPKTAPLENHIQKLNQLKIKLEGRLKQKDYKYTQADIEIVKKAVKELDNLSTRYLVSSISLLEPLINSVLEKIDFQVKFDVDTKGKFVINLTKDNIVYNYKDLSSGQRLLVQIAFKLALLLEKNEEGIIIADEGLSNLDEENLQHIFRIFENYPFQLIMMLHRAENLPHGTQIIDLNKEE